MCWRAAEHTDGDTNRRAYDVWLASSRARMQAGDQAPEAIGHAYRIELLYRALVVVMARRGG